MTTRKRRPPEKRQAGRVSRVIAGGAAMIGQAAMRNPVATGGTTAFAIVFSFVAANALWYQPSAHPHPWLDTRDAFRDYAAKAMHIGGEPATTFRVERDAAANANVAKPARPPQPASDAPAYAPVASAAPAQSVIVDEGTAQNPDPTLDLLSQVQQNLARRGLYDGPVDGVMGPKTQAAIIFYQETRGLPETGEADAGLLDLLKKDNSEFNVIPPDRPTDVTGAIAAKTPQKAPDPVAALIAKTPRAAAVVPPAPIPAASAKTAQAKPAAAPKPITIAARQTPAAATQPSAAADKPVSSDLVKMIQKGLANLAYRDVTVDGVAGTQTKEAIRHFEKHYRLPITGEPNEAVLEKLKKIGAL